jgi:hypothetical protein
MIEDRVGDQVQLYSYKTIDTSIPLTIMLNHIIYELSWALAWGGASVRALQNRRLIGSQLRRCQFWCVTFYGYTFNPFSFSNENVNT